MAISLEDILEKAKTEIIDKVIFGEAIKVSEKAIQIRNFLWKSNYIHYEFLFDTDIDKMGIEIHLEHDDVKFLYLTLLTSFEIEFKENKKIKDCDFILDPEWRENRGRLRLIPHNQYSLDVIISTMFSFILETEKRINEELSKSFDIDNFIKDFIDFSNQQTVGEGVVGLDNFNSKYGNKIYKNLKVEYSVGKGRAGEISWVSFLSYNQKTSKGIFPCIHYDKKNSKLNLLYDVSKNKDIDKKWINSKNKQIFKEFDLEKILNNSESIKNDLDKIIDEYHSEFAEDIKSEKNIIELKKEGNIMSNEKKQSLNQILYGPPGTGKTYNTINKAIEIIDPSFNLKEQPRTLIKEKFDNLVKEGRIVFTTFHQSMSYEDFVEGIKPKLNKNGGKFIEYEVSNGILKKIIVKILNNYLNVITKDIILPKQKEVIRKLLSERTKITYTLEKETLEVLYFSSKTYTSNKLERIAPSEYRANLNVVLLKEIKDFLVFYKSIDSKTLEEIKKIKISDKEELNDENMQIHQAFSYFETICEYDIYHPDILLTLCIYAINKMDSKEFNDAPSEKFVLIIDEINRGNVSQIFGELITLIEEDKRLGNSEALEVTLPYSKEKFGVPSNLYIIGTMNTADRSVEALDTALRRRFTFEEMPPRYDLPELDIEIEGIKLSKILETINKRIEKILDKDHLIGHSFFINVKTLEDLQNTFYKNIIPLLQEYFFGDYGKIGLILGSSFVSKKGNEKDNIFSDFKYDALNDLNEKVIYEIKDYKKNIEGFKEAIKNIFIKDKKSNSTSESSNETKD